MSTVQSYLYVKSFLNVFGTYYRLFNEYLLKLIMLTMNIRPGHLCAEISKAGSLMGDSHILAQE